MRRARAASSSCASASSASAASHRAGSCSDQRDVVAFRRPARVAARFAVEHQCKQAARFRFVGQEVHEQPGEIQGLAGKIAAAGIASGGVVPRAAVGRVDRGADRIQPRREFVAAGHVEADSRIADLRLGAREALAHGAGRHQERRGDARGVEAEHGLQHQRRMDGRVDGWVRADEQQLQAVVGKRRGIGHRLILEQHP